MAVSPSSQSTQLSVKWAFPQDSDSTENVSNTPLERQERSERTEKSSEKQRAKKSLSADYFGYQPYIEPYYMEPLETPGNEYINSEDEDYSLSVSAVIQRRASIRGRKKGYISPRRASSPMGHVSGVSGGIGAGNSIVAKGDRRRSSVYTTSSGDTAISFGDGANNPESTKEQIFENIRLHKEVLQSVKMQPWSMRRKLRLVRQAKEYIARHEGALQERFAMSRSTKDLWTRFKIVFAVRWQHFRRELANLSTVLIPWQLRIKEIESHFGSVVASYFTFLRWIFWVNIVISVTLSVFVVGPEFIASKFKSATPDYRKNMLGVERKNATRLSTIIDFEGFLKYSPLFYGYYSDYSGAVQYHYELPLAYFIAGLAVYVYSFWAILRKMAENSRMSKLSSKDDECVFSWKLFTGWDFMIGHAETAHNRMASVVLGFKEALLEEAERKKEKRNWKIIVSRIIVNLLVLTLLGISAAAVILVVERSSKESTNMFMRNAITIVITAISIFFPMCFEALGYLERYHPRKQLRMQLARIMVLNLLNLYSLIIAQFGQISVMNDTLEKFKQNETVINNFIKNFTLRNLYVQTASPIADVTDYGSLNLTDTTAFISNITLGTISTTMPTTTSVIKETLPFIKRLLRAKIKNCRKMKIVCNKSVITSLIIMNITRNLLPEIFRELNESLVTNTTPTKVTTFTPNTFDNAFDESTSLAHDFETQNFTTESYTEDSNVTDYTKISVDFSKYSSTTSDYYEENDYNEETGELVRNKREPLEYEFEKFKTKNIESDGSIDGDKYLSQFEKYNQEMDEIIEENATDSASSTFWTTDSTTNDGSSVTTNGDNDYDTTTAGTATETDDDVNENPFYDLCYVVCTKYDEDVKDSLEDTTTLTTFTEPTARSPYTVPTVICITPTGASNGSITQNITFAGTNITYFIDEMHETRRLELTKLCWETMFGQELVKLTVFDLFVVIFASLFMDFLRALFVRFMNKCWCWDLEKRFPKYGDFKIAENILHLINNQGQVWMGMFFSPGLTILNLFKLFVLMYFRSWVVLTCNVPHEVIFRASRSNNFYLALLLTMLFLCVLPVAYAIVWIKPSWHCGPFANYGLIYHIFTKTLKRILPLSLHVPMDKIASPSTVIPLLLLLILIIYYLISLTGALREANQDLKNQLRRERQEERRKMLQRVVTAKLDDNNGNSAMDRWRKVLEASSPLTPTVPGQPSEPDEEKIKARREFLARIMKKALRKSSNTSDDESHPADDDETDTEQHESLPHDQDVATERKSSVRRKDSSKSLLDDKKTDSSKPRKSSFARMRDIVEIATRKADQTKGEPKTETKATKAAGKGSKKPNVSSSEQEEEYNKAKVVSERRLLRRQQSTQESDASVSLHPLHPKESETEEINYKVVNEKNKAVEKKSKQPAIINTEPEIFKFDKDPPQNKKENADDSYKKIILCPKKEKPSPKQSSSGSTFPSSSKTSSDITLQSPTYDHNKHKHDDAKNESRHPKLSAYRKTEVKSDKRDTSPPTYALIKKSPVDANQLPIEKHRSDDDLLKQPMRKLNSFLALVREAVHVKKQEPNDPISCMPEIQARVRAYIDDSNSISISEEGSSTKNSDSTSSQQMRYGSSKRRRRVATTDPPKAKRQDSQASIWSDNIPVITISKTESDECILDKKIDEVESENKDESNKK